MRIHLGYEVITSQEYGAPKDCAVTIPMHHMMITGMTRLSGKTTTIEALLSRLPEGFTALVFRTKRGEVEFTGAHRVEPYFRPSVDWEYVESLLEAAMKQRLKFERSWVIRASRNATTLRDVYDNIQKQLENEKLRGIDESIYTNLQAYFEKILPQLEEHPFADQLELESGVNVMELGHLSEEVQALVISSCLEVVQDRLNRTVVVIPEAWLFLPQARGNPVKWSAQRVIRQGGASENYLWLDSQDVTTVTKDVLKSVGVWLMGRQQEINEVKRVLDQLPTREKPKTDDVMTLAVGHFYVATEDICKKIYVQPAWGSDEDAFAVASGDKPLEAIRGAMPARKSAPSPTAGEAETADRTELTDALRRNEELMVMLAEAEEARDLAVTEASQSKELAEIRQELLDQAEAKLDELEIELAPLQQLKLALENVLGAAPQYQPPELTEQVINGIAIMVANRLGQTPAVQMMAPLPALKQQYQQETVNRLATEVGSFEEAQRRGLEWLLAVGKSTSYRQLCLGLGYPTGGDGYIKFTQSINVLVKKDWIQKDKHGLKAKVTEKVEKGLEAYDPTPEEVEETVNHLIASLSEQKNGAADVVATD